MSNLGLIQASLGIVLTLPAGGKRQAVLNSATYESMSKSERVTLAGTDTTDWQDFKSRMVPHQSKLGLTWQAIQGAGGPLAFVSFSVPSELGKQVAVELFKTDEASGAFSTLVFAKIGLDKSTTEKLKRDFMVEWKEAKDAFSGYRDQAKNESFRFERGPGRDSFRRVKREIKFVGGTEKALHGLLEDSGSIRQQLELAGLKRYTGLGKGQYKNVDLLGYRLIRQVEGDFLQLAAIEVKRENTVGSVMQAIAQATSYRSISERSYVAVPGFTESDYHDPDGFQEIKEMCEQNGIGMISIRLNEHNRGVEDVELVTDAKLQITSDSGLKEICVRSFGLEYCHVCRRWIPEDIVGMPEDCGWRVRGSCMRETVLNLAKSYTPP